ncbi:MAG: MFS transporter [Actinobacteria bacterium]|nr:MAG: MFS transporter [Actinomycetota bacterium]
MRSLLGIRDFRLLFLGQAASNWGDALTSITLLILTQRLTGSVAAVAGTAIAVALPQLLFGLPAGVFVDRWDRKRVMVVSDVVRGILVLGFVFVTSADLLWLMYVVAFAQAAIGTFFNPAKGAMIPAIVPGDRLLAANSMMETSRIVLGLLGTAAAGVYAGVSQTLWPVFVVDSMTFILSAVLVQAIRTESRGARGEGSITELRHELTIGLRTAVRSRPLVGVFVGAGVVMLGLGAVNVLLVPFVVDDLGVSETWFGALEASQVSSMVLSGMLVAVLAARFRPTRLVATGLVATGILTATIATVGSVWQFMAVLFAAGWFLTPLQASMSTIVQSEVPDELRGRIGSTLSTIVQTANVTSMALAGVAAAAFGMRSVFVGSGVIGVGAGILAFLLFRTAEARTPARERAPEASPA